MPSIGWATDLHLDHAPGPSREAFGAALEGLHGAPLILTGDISVARNLVADLEFIALQVAPSTTWFVLGNHDHYGSDVGSVRDEVIALIARNPRIQWLPPAGVVSLGDGTALVGVDGWADGRHGDPLHTPLVLNDDRLIGDLRAQPDRKSKLAIKRALADADASRLSTLLERAVTSATSIVIATHVPPFPEALPDSGRVSGNDWLPILICGATGSVLRRIATEHPGHDFLVLSGHTHVEHEAVIAPNLRCIVGGARYGTPLLRQMVV